MFAFVLSTADSLVRKVVDVMMPLVVKNKGLLFTAPEVTLIVCNACYIRRNISTGAVLNMFRLFSFEETNLYPLFDLCKFFRLRSLPAEKVCYPTFLQNLRSGCY